MSRSSGARTAREGVAARSALPARRAILPARATPRPARRVGAAVLALAAATAVAAGCSTGKGDAVAQGGTFQFVSPGGQTEIHYEPADRKPLDELAGPSVLDPDTRISLDDYAGQVVVVNLWGQWCAPCRSEVDDLERLQEANADDGFTVLGINLRDPNRQKPVDFIEDNGVTYPSIWDPSQAAVAALHGFPTSVVPSTLVLDREHRVAAVFLAEVSDVSLQPVLDPLLAEPAPAGAEASPKPAATTAPAEASPKPAATTAPAGA